jgi:hypothetical protein
MIKKDYSCPLDLGLFWEENFNLLKRLAKTSFPRSAIWKFYYREVAAGSLQPDVDQYYLDVSIVNMSNRAKRYCCIEALFEPKTLEIIEECIKFGYDIREYGPVCDITELSSYEIKSEKHKEWLRNLLKKHLKR